MADKRKACQECGKLFSTRDDLCRGCRREISFDLDTHLILPLTPRPPEIVVSATEELVSIS